MTNKRITEARKKRKFTDLNMVQVTKKKDFKGLTGAFIGKPTVKTDIVIGGQNGQMGS